MCLCEQFLYVIGLVTIKSETFRFGPQLEPEYAVRECGMPVTVHHLPRADQTNFENPLAA